MTPANRAYWDHRTYRFDAQAPTLEPSPSDLALSVVSRQLIGNWLAIPAGDGLTYWAFATEAGRQHFLDAYPQATILATKAIFGQPT